MALIFTDWLKVNDASGLYTLKAYIGGMWTNLHTITGVQDGTVTVNENNNTISVNTQLMPPGHTYNFKWADSIGNESNVIPLYVPVQYLIRGYSTAVATIDIVNTLAGADQYNISFHFTPTSLQSTAGAVVTEYEYKVNHYIAGVKTQISTGVETGNITVPVSGLGAGVYDMNCTYTLSDGSKFEVSRLTKTDANGNILADIMGNGIIINSFSGLSMNATAINIQSNVNYTIHWAAYNGTNLIFMATGNTATFTLPADTLYVIAFPDINDSVFSDISGDAKGANGFQVFIS